MENFTQQKKGIPFFKLVKNNLLLMVLIIVLVGLIGTLFGVLYAKPTCKASRSAILRTELQSSSPDAETNNASLAFLVIGQLEYHFTSADYIEIANEKYLQINSQAKDKISAGNIIIEYKEESLIFTLSYQDTNKERAINKLKAVFDASEDYFKSHSTPYNIKLIPTDNAGTDDGRFIISENNGLSSYILIGVIAGVILSVVVVLIKGAFDNTVHDKDELEDITGSNMLACIEKRN